jgi:alpha-glucosidase
MMDFMDRDDQLMVRFYHEVLEKAAAHHLTVTLHGACKPTGLCRTFPNLLTMEGVLNLEYNKWGRGSTPDHELIVPFTRMLAGPLDYHQGGFRHATEETFESRYTGPMVVGTRARMLAMYIVYENYLPMVADHPAAYRGESGFDFVAGMPTVWDETRVLTAAVGDMITVARRRGNVWYVGTMTDGTARRSAVSLNFLGSGPYLAWTYADGPAGPSRAITRRFIVTGSDVIRFEMAPAGGHAMRLTPAARGKRCQSPESKP